MHTKVRLKEEGLGPLLGHHRGHIFLFTLCFKKIGSIGLVKAQSWSHYT